MRIVAKAILIDEDDRYLMMRRSDHPTFGYDPDLPGGTLEADEEPLSAMLREVVEEIGVTLDPQAVLELYSGDGYSAHKTVYHLYEVRIGKRPDIVMSWEHDSYEWIDSDEFIAQSGSAVDTYMHMVHDVMKRRS